MATVFKSINSRVIGTTPVKISNYNVPASTTATVIGFSVANLLIASVNVDVYVNDGTNNIYIVKNAPIIQGSSLVLVGGDQKLVLMPGYSLYIVSSTAASIDAYVSLMESS
ncbi:virion structural protein [Rhizobium phage RHph_TM39]|uniref:Virion structural protein n=1 Tax=Rhizobium phage RHph_TM30 TaxID=2509764 RepID=A0A7S5UW66_9CAUD|nr:virion structural protein [Rhizobium phage RHph_TM30]QIG71803.1 virion structural protein [Rhizobium phage RHph_TM40]QIG72163.1 virion structural protein [Rhizobium phage RHph_TM2_3B]QIG72526.1 virion structural protein [Rhizobium phage RHph_TM3_3_6]QIG77296.1 virion structural protein [Rhizobium phage RHph_TM39]QIG71439.1 virion structural protein [Rhizobium phage RHph_TM30]